MGKMQKISERVKRNGLSKAGSHYLQLIFGETRRLIGGFGLKRKFHRIGVPLSELSNVDKIQVTAWQMILTLSNLDRFPFNILIDQSLIPFYFVPGHRSGKV